MAQFMSLVTTHNKRTAAAGGTNSASDPFSLDGYPVGTAADLMDFGAQVGALK